MERGAALFGKATFVNPCLKTFQDKFFLEQDTVDSLMENSEKTEFFRTFPQKFIGKNAES